MKSITVILIGFILIPAALMAQKKSAFELYDEKGKKTTYKKLLKEAQEADFVCFGESHDNPIVHWLQYELLTDLIEIRKRQSIVVGMEMLERHQQDLINQYLKGDISADSLAKQTKLWGNYDTDYRPIVDLCKSLQIPVIATNIPRKYARMVAFEGGVDGLAKLTHEELAQMVPLPFKINYDLPSYQAMREMMAGHGSEEGTDNFIAAQAIKDATMAHFSLQNWKPGKLFFHLNGSYHSDDKEGIIWYLLQAEPDLKVFNLSMVEQDDVTKIEDDNKGKADVTIVVPKTMTKTYRQSF